LLCVSSKRHGGEPVEATKIELGAAFGQQPDHHCMSVAGGMHQGRPLLRHSWMGILIDSFVEKFAHQFNLPQTGGLLEFLELFRHG